MATEIIGTIGFFITMIIFIVTFFKTRHTERMALINSGRTAKVFQGNDSDTNQALKFGLILLSVGLGLLVGMIFDSIFDTEPAAVFVCILIFGGISLIFYHSYINGKNKATELPHDIDDMV
jgi:hypothetical protein